MYGVDKHGWAPSITCRWISSPSYDICGVATKQQGKNESRRLQPVRIGDVTGDWKKGDTKTTGTKKMMKFRTD